MEKEIYVRVKDNPTYQISNFGNLKNFYTGLQLSPFLKNKNIVSFSTILNGRQRIYSAARLVAETFVERKENDSSKIVHIDGNIWNNRADNLKWIPYKEKILKRKNHIKVRCVETGEIFESATAAARKYGLNNANILSVVHKRRFLSQHNGKKYLSKTCGCFHWEKVDD